MKLRLLKIWLLVLVCLPVANCYAQTQRIDSLKKVLHKSGGIARLGVLFDLCEEKSSLHGDSLYAYAKQARKIAEAENSPQHIAFSNYCMCNALLKKSFFDSVINESNRQLEWIKRNQLPPDFKNKFEYVKAQALVRSNQFKEALTQYNQLLSHAEAASDTDLQMRAKTGIGWIHMELNQNDKALQWFINALATATNQQMIGKYGVIYVNMASIYNNMNLLDSAQYCINKALADAKQYQQLANLANALNVQGTLLIKLKKNEAAEKAFKEALEYRRRIGDPFYVVSDMAELASFYALTSQYAKGIEIAQQGIGIAKMYRLDAKLPMLYTSLGQNLRSQGNYKAYSMVQDTLLVLRDSLYINNSAEKMADLQSRYDVQRKENIIIQKNLDLIQRDYLLYATISVFAFLVVLFLILYRNYRKRQKLVMERMVKEQQQRETIAILKAEEKERKRIAADLHDNLGAYAAAISANVKMLNDSKSNRLQLQQQIEENVDGIVSQLSNTIWVLKKPNQLLTEVGDRFKAWLQKLMNNYPLIQHDVIEKIDADIMLSAACALHLYYMMQECVNNAVKHSKCTRLTITLLTNGSNLRVTIADDGNGFEIEKTKPGNGLGNIKQRAILCNWNVAWQQNPNGKGTSVLITDGFTN